MTHAHIRRVAIGLLLAYADNDETRARALLHGLTLDETRRVALDLASYGAHQSKHIVPELRDYALTLAGDTP